MKALLSVLVFTMAIPALAAKNLDKQPCAEFARGAAESLYIIEASAIQGHQFESTIVSYEANGNTALVTVEVDGSNEDRDSWVAKYEVEVSTPYCKIESMGAVK